MLAAAHRLRRSSEFATVIRAGRRSGRGAVVVHLHVPDRWPVPIESSGHDEPHRSDEPAGPDRLTADRLGRAPTDRLGQAPTDRLGQAPTDRLGQAADAIASPRAGFVVSRAVGGASRRNLVRRRLRHLVRERLDQLPAGAVLVVRALPAAGSASYARLGADLDAALAAAQAPRHRTSDR